MFSIDELNKFTEDIASKTPTPAGGSVSALCGAMSAALTAMSVNYTVGKEKFKDREAEMNKLSADVQKLRKNFMQLMQQDIEAYNNYSSALKMPKETDSEQHARYIAMQQTLRESSEVPLAVLECCHHATICAQQACQMANPNLITDSYAAAVLANAAAHIASYNVRTNISGISDKKVAAKYRVRMANLLSDIEDTTSRVELLVSKYFDKDK